MAGAAHVQKETARYLVEDKGRRLPVHRGQGQSAHPCSPPPMRWTGHTSLSPVPRVTAGTAGTRPAPLRGSSGAGRPVPHPPRRSGSSPHDGRLRPAAAAPGITSRTLQRGGTPGAIAAAARGHRDIEALHQVRDTTMNEAAQRLRAGLSAQVIAAVRNAAVAAPRLAGFTSTAPGRRWAVRNPARPVTVLNLA
jgi:hypothetical protein